VGCEEEWNQLHKNDASHISKDMAMCFTKEYNEFYKTMSHIKMDAFVTYESLLSNLVWVLSTIDKSCPDLIKMAGNWYDKTVLIMPGGRSPMRVQHQRPTDAARMYHDELGVDGMNWITKNIDHDVLNFYGYHNNGIWIDKREGLNAL